MALQVWLPLNGNLNNQGLEPSSFIKRGSKDWSKGKVTEKCFGNSSQTTSSTATDCIYTVTTHKWTKNFSVAFWASLPPYDPAYPGYIFTEGRADAGDYGFGARMYSSGVSCCFGSLVLTIQIPSKDSTYNWHHISMVVDDNSKMTVYLDGIENTSGTPSVLPTYTTDTGLGIGCFYYNNSFIYQILGFVNDFRLYDHCLSQKEIKELSKGLCLHYKLSRGGENLLSSTTSLINGASIPSKYADYVKNYTVQPNKSYIFSFDAYASENTKIHTLFHSYPNNTPKMESFKNCQGISGGYTGETEIDITTIKQRYWFMAKYGDGNATNKSIGIRLGTIYSGHVAGAKVYVTNIKLEEGDRATPWTPNKSDALYSQLGYNNIEPDCSGYGNDGTINGTLTYSNDTPRYEGSSYFGYTQNVQGSFVSPSTPITISFWAKVSQFDNSGWVVLAGQSTGYYLDADANSGANWHSKATVSKYYRDGTLVSSANTMNQFISRDGEWHHYAYICTLTDWTKITVNGGSLWGSSWRANVNISDFRIYATALSAEDIKALYNTPISIDNSKNLHCMELEQTNNQTSFCKSGVAKMELLPIPTITERCAGNNYTKQLKRWANGSQLKLNDVHKIRIIFRSRGDGTPTSSKCSSIGCIMNENAWKWTVSPIWWSSATAYSNIGKIIDYTGSLTVNSTMTSTTTSIPITLYWIIQNGWANGNDGQTHDLYYYKYWNATTGKIYAEGGTPEYDRITVNDFMED